MKLLFSSNDNSLLSYKDVFEILEKRVTKKLIKIDNGRYDDYQEDCIEYIPEQEE